jgi:hypothetical protein
MVRDVEDFDPVKNQECIQSVTQSWPGDLSTKEDQNAFMVSIVHCINGSQTKLATRDFDASVPVRIRRCIMEVRKGWLEG